MFKALLPIALAVHGGDVALPAYLVLVNHQALQAHRAPGVDLVGADADLGTEAIPHSVGKARGCIPVDAGRIHARHEFLGELGRRRQDRVRVLGAVGVDMRHCLVHVCDGLHR